MTLYFANSDNTYWGGYDGLDSASVVPADAVEVPAPPPTAHCLWNGSAWVLDGAAEESAKDQSATDQINTPVNKLLRDLLWDLEQRLRAAGQVTSDNPDITAATTKDDYTAALKTGLKARL